jgi:hypothetical protein
LALEREKFDFSDAQEKFLVGRLKQYINWNLYQKKAEIYQNYKRRLQAIKVNEAKDRSKLNTAICTNWHGKIKFSSIKNTLAFVICGHCITFVLFHFSTDIKI